MGLAATLDGLVRQSIKGEGKSMMCLGWKTKAECKTRGTVEIGGDQASPCPDITWFYLALAAIGVGAMVQNPGSSKGVVETAI